MNLADGRQETANERYDSVYMQERIYYCEFVFQGFLAVHVIKWSPLRSSERYTSY